jgi:hypothetical protein
MIPKVALMVITDGRWDYLKDTLESAFEMLDWPFEQCLLVDDSGEGRLFNIPGWETIQNPERKGLAGAIQTGWDNLYEDIEYVFHLEDDFTFPDLVDIGLMVHQLEGRSDLAQIALLRQPWSPEEHVAGGIMNLYRDEFTEEGSLVVHQRLFTFNPCLYPRWVTRYQADLEAGLTEDLVADGKRFAYFGALDDPPRCTHIGVRRTRAWQL